MEVVYNSDQIINIGAVEVIKVEKENDFFNISILKRTKFKWVEIKINEKFASVDAFLGRHASKFLNVKDELYINVSKILFVQREKVAETIDTIDVTIHLVNGEPFAIRTTGLYYELVMRRMREG